jgi:hypothetical protein
MSPQPWYVIIIGLVVVLAAGIWVGNRFGSDRGLWVYIVGGFAVIIVLGGIDRFIGA